MTEPWGMALMYHYIRPRGQDIPRGIRPLLAEEFETQLDWLSDRFDILGGNELADLCAGRRTLTRPFCLLTFDDGTRDHATVATPILARRGLSGFFFLLSGPWTDKRLPMAHRVHVVLSRLSDARLWEMLQETAGDASLGDEAEARRIYHYEDNLARQRIKYAINFALPAELVDTLLGQVIASEIGNEAALVNEWFVSPDQAREIAAAGMTIGAHGHSHTSLARLTPAAAEEEITRCHRTLAQTLGQAPRWYAYPFGGSGGNTSTLDHCEQFLQSLGYAGLCIVGQSKDPWLRAPVGFAKFDRFDCIRFPPRGNTLLPS